MAMRAVNTIDQDRLAHAIARDGLVAYNDSVMAMVLRARSTGVRSPALDVLGDIAQPEVARQRAFGKVAAALAARRRTPRDRKAA
ncbi:MAG: hypothetical protein WKF45_05465 [Ilumatobacteraceae bacterium]